MRKIICIIFALSLLSCSSFTERETDITNPALTRQDNSYSPFYDGELNVYFSEDATEQLLAKTKSPEMESALLSATNRIGILSMERVFPDAGRFEERTRAEGLHRWYRIRFDNTVPLDDAASAIADIPGVEHCEKILKAKIQSEPFFNDPMLPNQWHYANDGSKYGWLEGADINVIPVWQMYTTGSPDVIVAVVDGGVDYNHEDLAGQVLVAQSVNYASGGQIHPQDHGTHVAGTIAAINNNGIGVSGIAGGDILSGNTGTKIISCQVFDTNSNGASISGGFDNAIKWAADHGAVICNNSWGYDFTDDNGVYDGEAARKSHELFSHPNSGEYTHVLKSAIDYFNKYAGIDENGKQVGPMAGGLVLFSAGNDTRQYGPPANYSEVMAVGSIGPDGTRAYYSSFGDWVDIAAPGGDARVTSVLSTLPGNEYGYMQGTSMACPHVSGVAALVVAACGGPGFTREMLINRLINGSSTKINLANMSIGPLIDATGAVTYGSVEIPGKVNDLSAEVSSNNITFSWSVTDSDNGIPAYAYIITYGKDYNTVKDSSPKNPSSEVSSLNIVTGAANSGETITGKASKLDFESVYYAKITGYDYNLNYGKDSDIIEITTPSNNKPIIVREDGDSVLQIKSFEKKIVLVDISDPDGHSVSVNHQGGSEAESFMLLPDGKYQITIKGNAVPAGTYSGTITATDEFGAYTACTITYTILTNQAPVCISEIDNVIISSIGILYNTDMGKYFTDPDGEALFYEFTFDDPSVVHATADGNTLYITSLKYGATTAYVKAIDAAKEYTEASFKILVRSADIKYQLYPNPVVDTLYIATGEDEEILSVKIASSSGNIVYDAELPASAFSPARIDMSSCSPGSYIAQFTFGNQSFKHLFVKQ